MAKGRTAKTATKTEVVKKMVEETIEAKTNPFDEGVTYEQVVKELGSKSVSTYYKDMLTNEQIEWLTADLEVYKNNQKAK